jgi:putative addiction module component (TIGR02574 family)
MNLQDIDFNAMPLDERALLAHRLWETVRLAGAAIDDDDMVIRELDRRFAALDSGLSRTYTIDEVKMMLAA